MSYNKKILNQIHKPLIKAQYGYSGKPTLRQIMQMPDKRYSPSPAVMDTKAGLAAASLAMGPYSFVPGIAGATYDVGTAARYAMDGQWDNVKEDLISAGLNILPTAAVYGALASMGKLQKAARARAAIRSAKIGNNFKDFASSSTIKNKVTGLVQEFDKAGKEISSMRPRSAAEVKYHNQNIQNQYRTGYTPEGPSEYMPFMSPKYTYGGQPCYECGGMYAEGGFYDCLDQEKDPVTGKCKADEVRGKQANAANKAATTDMNAWAKQVAAMDKEVARQNAAQAAGQLTFDYDWMGSPVDKAEKKAAMGQYKQFFQQNPNTFIADDTSGYSPEQKYVVASKLKQRISTPMGSKLFQQQYGVDPRYYDLQRLQSEVAPKMGGWNGMRNWLFNVFKEEGGPIVDPMGQWAYPGQVTRIPGSNITMQGVPYPVYGVGSNGQEQMMQPGQEYNFGGAAYVDEYPMMQRGGWSGGGLSRFDMETMAALNKDIKEQKARDSQVTISQYTPKPGDQERMNANKDAYRKEQGKFLNRLADNQHMQSAGKNLPGAAEFALDVITAGEAAVALKAAKPLLKAAGKYLTEKTPLRNAHKFNPSALTDNILFNKEGVVNRQMFGDDAYNSFLKSGPTTRPNVSEYDQMMEFIKAPRSQVRSANDEVFEVAKTMEDGAFKYPYFQEGNLWYTGKQRSNLAKEIGKERIITTPKDIWFAPAGEGTVMSGDDLISKGLIDSYSKGRRVLMPGSEYANPSKYSVFEPHWWKGYKQLQEDGGQILNEYPMMQGGGQYFFMNLNDGFNKRIKNTDYVKGEYNKGIDFHTKWLNSPMYKSMINASDPVNAKNITDQRKDRLSAVTMKYVDDQYNSILGKAGASADQLGNIEVYPAGIGKNGVGTHEISHVTDTGYGLNLIPAKDKIDIARYSLASENMPKYEANKESFNYITKPSETRARLNEIRQGASENKLYDPFTQKVNPAIYNKLKNFKFNSRPGSDPLQQLKSAYSDEQILQMLNSVSKVNNNNIQDMMYAKQGGEMIRRADGSYSRRGLWDNIRANKGSGKKPSKEMLEQERKIKAKSMANGGTNNAGFEALPEYVQAKILSNMGYGGYYNPMMATGGERMPPEIARARFAAAGNLDQMSNYGYAYGGYIPEMMYGGYDYMAEGGEPNGGMALGQMAAVADKMNKLRQFISPEQNLDPWIASKLAVIDDSTAAISDYMMYNPEAQEMEQGMPEMGRGGYTVTRSNDRKGKTHKVTGPDGTVKYFGDSKLGQHPKDPKRKAAFYARHKKNLAGNPFFRAFARKTWEDGGSTFSGNAFYQSGGPVEGEVMDVTPEEAEMLRKQGYQFEIV